MRQSERLVETFKQEGLSIVDQEGFPYDSEEINSEAWQRAIDGMDLNFGESDHESAWDYYFQDIEDRRQLEIRRAIAISNR